METIAVFCPELILNHFGLNYKDIAKLQRVSKTLYSNLSFSLVVPSPTEIGIDDFSFYFDPKLEKPFSLSEAEEYVFEKILNVPGKGGEKKHLLLVAHNRRKTKDPFTLYVLRQDSIDTGIYDWYGDYVYYISRDYPINTLDLDSLLVRLDIISSGLDKGHVNEVTGQRHVNLRVEFLIFSRPLRVSSYKYEEITVPANQSTIINHYMIPVPNVAQVETSLDPYYKILLSDRTRIKAAHIALLAGKKVYVYPVKTDNDSEIRKEDVKKLTYFSGLYDLNLIILTEIRPTKYDVVLIPSRIYSYQESRSLKEILEMHRPDTTYNMNCCTWDGSYEGKDLLTWVPYNK